jgi:hypothetical protein
VRVWPAVNERMDERIEVGSASERTCGEASAKALRHSVDYWRTHRRSDNTCTIAVPQDAPVTANAGDLVDDKPLSAGEKLALGPHSTIVLYLGTTPLETLLGIPCVQLEVARSLLCLRDGDVAMFDEYGAEC